MAAKYTLVRASLLLVPILVAFLYGPSIRRPLTVLGFFRKPNSTPLESNEDIVIIEDTAICEDLHYYMPANLLFTACEDSPETRFAWFPPLTKFYSPELAARARGSIHVIDAETKRSRRLEFENFNGPFISHGIDVTPDPDAADDPAVFILAVNHVPDERYLDLKQGKESADGAGTAFNKASSRVEVFRHVLGSSTARHVRTIRHPLIATPNDVLARGPSEFFVTNDHFYREGLLRTIEDVYFQATWTNIIHVRYGEFDNGTQFVDATVALTGLHNNNGLGHSSKPDQILMGSATSGTLHIGKVEGDGSSIVIQEHIELDSAIDNPSYFKDAFAENGFDGSGYVLAGLSNGATLDKTSRDPSATEGLMVWLVRPLQASDAKAASTSPWEKRLLFEDDGSRIRGASTAVLVAIDPATEGGKRRAWLFVTGFLSLNMIAVKVDL